MAALRLLTMQPITVPTLLSLWTPTLRPLSKSLIEIPTTRLSRISNPSSTLVDTIGSSPSLDLVSSLSMLRWMMERRSGIVAVMWKTPSEHVIDTMEAVMDADSGDYKRLHSNLDSGFQYVSGTYTGESVRRVLDNGRLLDTDNSTEDYYVTEAIGDCGVGL